MPERLRRLSQVFERSPIYFATICTTNRRAILANNIVHSAFVDFARIGPTHGAWVGAYVIMPDHLHLFLSFDRDSITLSAWVKSLKNALSKVLRPSENPSPQWQKGFFDHVLRSQESYGEKWNYVRQNPVRAGFVEEWKDWPYLGEIFDLEYRRDRI